MSSNVHFKRMKTQLFTWLGAAALVACHGGAMDQGEDNQTAVDDSTAKLAQSGGDGEKAPGAEHSGTAGLNGPAQTGLVGWRSKDGSMAEVGLAQAGAADFEASVRARIGHDPFRLGTVAGDVAITRGVASDLQNALRDGATQDVIALVMPSMPAQMAVEDQLRQRGMEILGMASGQVYIVRAPSSAWQQLAGDPLVYWMGQMPRDLKIEPELARYLGLIPGQADDKWMEADRAVVALYDDRDADMVQRAVEMRGALVDDYDPRIRTIYTTGLDANAVLELASLQEVSFVDTVQVHHTTLETSVDRSGNHDYVRDTWTYGANVALGMIDSGIQLSHSMFVGWSPYPALYARGWNVSGEGSMWNDNPSGHGTHVAGIILGRWLGQNLDGMAPRSGGDANHRFRVVRTGKDTGSPTAIYNANQAMDNLASDNGAEVINNSWSSNNSSGTNSSSVKADSISWDNGQIYVFAAGNDGTASGSIDSPAAAKNVIAVGSVNNSSTLPLSWYSSQGPTSDNRDKPDIYAVGAWVTSADAGNLNGSVTWNGTSMATPHVTGFLGTLLDHYSAFQRRPALAKAYLMASAVRQSGLPTRTGTLNSYQAHYTTSTTGGKWGWRDSDPRPYSYTYWDTTVPSGVSEMYVVLTWIEPETSIGASSAVFNDVDLWVDHNRDDNGYGEWASAGIGDNVEFVKITSPPSGNYRINARNYNAPVNYKPAYALFYIK